MPHAVPGWFDHVRSPLALTDSSAGLALALNQEALRFFGPATPTMPCALSALIGEHAATIVAGMHGPDPSPPPRIVEAKVAGEGRTLGLALSRLEDGRHLLTIQDLMAQYEAADRLSALEEDIHEIMQSLPIGVEIYDGEGNCLFVNGHGAAVLGYAADEMMNLEEWWPSAYPDPAYRAAAMAAWNAGVQSARADLDHVHMADWMVTCKDGSQKMIHFRLRSLGDNLILVYWDVSDHRQLVHQLRMLADTDDLTGLGNRRRFLAESEAALRRAREAGTPVALLMIDLDFFKAINDRFGHAVGDLMLRDVADKCRRTLREQDLLARLGGEEFAALLPGVGEAEALRVAQMLRSFVAAAPMMIEGRPIPATISIGVALLEGQAARVDASTSGDLSDLLRRADEALYAAKRSGRNRVMRDEGVPGVA